MFNHHKLGILLSTTLLLVSTSIAWAQSQSDLSFDEGVVAVYCFVPNESEIQESVFEEAFPMWIEALQNLANDGVIIRAHYLPNLRRGVFIVVGGESLEDAKKNAMIVDQSNKSILKAALQKAGVTNPLDGTCQHIEIGPVAILPNN